MKKVGEIMKELGFNEESSDSVKEAFIRHLIKASTGAEVPPRHSIQSEKAKGLVDEQLSFSFDENLPSRKAI